MSERQKYNPSCGGHAPGYLRDALIKALIDHCDDAEEGTWWRYLEIEFFSLRQQIRWETWTPKERGVWLAGQLWNCRDILPGSVCTLAGFPKGSTYARLARQLRRDINAPPDFSEMDYNGVIDVPGHREQ
jgi:hypothetical protein